MTFRSLALFFLMCLASLASAQHITVESFDPAPYDLTANLEGTTVYDQNGNECALIRIQTTQKGFSFDVGLLRVRKVDDEKVGEIWVYVPAGVKYITIRHDQLGTLEKYKFGVNIEKKKTYVMKLSTANVHTYIEEEICQQWVAFQVSPRDALLTFDGKLESLDLEGGCSVLKPFGEYSYKVEADLYYPEEKTIKVNDPNNKHTVIVSLKPAFGALDIPAADALKGAKVYVDNKPQGEVPCKIPRLKSGQHRVRIIQKMYQPLEETITISDGQTLTYRPVLKADYATVTLSVGGDAEIWVNGERKGAGAWTGNLSSGNYLVECRLAGHRTAKKQLAIGAAHNGKTIKLASPMPMYGKLNINSSPINANIYLNGEHVGTTPKQMPKCLVGDYRLKISKPGYEDYTETFTLEEGKQKVVNQRLQSNQPVAAVPAAGGAGGSNQPRPGGVPPAAPSSAGSLTLSAGGVMFTMVPVDGGTFRMGNEDGAPNELPLHNVTLSGYYIGQTEVTQELWEAVMGSNPSVTKGAKLPVTNVSWLNCKDFVARLSELTGMAFRLPTEAEWEFAARGGNRSQKARYSGGNDLQSLAWYSTTSNSEVHAVATKQPNELGIYDMSGNVGEWCSDWYANYEDVPVRDPQGPYSGTYRVLRGGSWNSETSSCRVSARGANQSSYTSVSNGLRLALSK